MRSEFGYRELPRGWDVCPPDEVSVAVCAQYSWQCTALALADLQKHATQGCMCQKCLSCDASRTPRQPHTSGSAQVCRQGRGVHVSGTDVLIRRPLGVRASADDAAFQRKPTLVPKRDGKAISDLAVLLARCCLKCATPQQQQHIRDFLERNEKAQGE